MSFFKRSGSFLAELTSSSPVPSVYHHYTRDIISGRYTDLPDMSSFLSQNDNTTDIYTNTTDEPLIIDNRPLAANILKITAMCLVMVLAVFGNMLVIISVFRYQRLRIIANSFIVSLAFADLTVALLVMPFSASMEIAGKWVFGPVVCNLFNANDVLFSTASLLHICCISMDRYIAITDPFHYESKMTKRRVALMLSCAWGASALISHIPVQLGWYTTEEGQVSDQDACPFIVNKIYCIISSSISFWTPTIVMVFTYVKIYREARKQEKQIHLLTKAAGPTLDKLNQSQVRSDPASSTSLGNGMPIPPRTRNGSFQPDRYSQERRKMKREHKAAKTLGIIMGAFLACWLPFFTWYVSSTMCGDYCHTPDVVVTMLFWVGYFNSALNPLIYACFNRDFRNAFKRLLGCGRHRHQRSSCTTSLRSYCHNLCCLRSVMRQTVTSGSENIALRPSCAELCSQPCNSRSNDSASSFQSNNNSPRPSVEQTRTYDTMH